MANQILTAAEAYIAAANLPSGATAATDFLPAATKTQCVAGALATYSRLFPRELTATAAGDGTVYLDLSTLTGWVEGLSAVVDVEFPYSSAALGENALPRDAWDIIDHPDNGKTLRFLEDTPGASQTVLVYFTALHADGDPAGSVRADHVDAVGKIAAANMAIALAARFASNKESTVGATWNGQSMSSRFTEWARQARKDGLADLGVGSQGSGGDVPGTPACALGVIDRDDYSSHGYGRLTHRRRRYSG